METMKRKIFSALVVPVAGLALSAWGCVDRDAITPTSGHAKLSVSEEIYPLLSEEVDLFEELYPDAEIDLQVKTVREAITDLFNDSVKVIVSARALNEEEREAQRQLGAELNEVVVARDAIAVIVNNSNPLTKMTLPMFDSIFTGTVRDWGIAGWRGAPGIIRVYLPERNKASYEVVSPMLSGGKTFVTPDSITVSSPDMIAAVEADPMAIGFVGMNWMRKNKERVRILELTNPSAPDSLGIEGKFIYPHQAYIYKGFYPIVRDIWIYSTPDSYGVSSGIISFLTSAAGQKIVLDQGLVPVTMPVRLVELKSESL